MKLFQGLITCNLWKVLNTNLVVSFTMKRASGGLLIGTPL